MDERGTHDLKCDPTIVLLNMVNLYVIIHPLTQSRLQVFLP